MVGWHHRLPIDMSLSKLQEVGQTGKSGVLQSMGLQSVGHNLGTEQQQQQISMYRLVTILLSLFLYHSSSCSSVSNIVPGI